MTTGSIDASSAKYEIGQQDISHLTRHLAITVQAARSLLVNRNRLAVRAQIEQSGANLTRQMRADTQCASCTQRFAAIRFKQQANAQVRHRVRNHGARNQDRYSWLGAPWES
jgi:hypothetical protein